MNNQNFQGQDLRGRSFKGQTLSDVDFSDCDLRGVNFSGATLTRVKFCRARMGKTLRAENFVFIFELLLGVVVLLLYFVGYLISEELFRGSGVDVFGVSFKKNSFEIYIFFVVFVCVAVWWSLKRKTGIFLYCAIGIEAVAVLVLGIIKNGPIDVGVLGSIGVVLAGFVTVVVTMFLAVVLAGVIEGVMFFPVAVSVMIFYQFGVEGKLSKNIILSSVFIFVFSLFCLYLGRRAVRGDVLLEYICRIRIKIESLFGNKFSYAKLSCVDFDGVDLRGVDFGGVQLICCNFKQTKNHHLALTTHSPLESRKVRELVVNGVVIEKNFQNLNLQGLNFSGLDLRGFDFSNSNVSSVNFENCDLRDADLSEVTALGTNFNHTKFTGACIKNWNIDKRTELQGVSCDFVYLDGDKKQRNPPEGDFVADEFSKLYQQVADTIDFIANNHEELDALIQAIKKIKENSGGADIFVQNIERKEDSVIVKVKAPPEFSKEEIYKEVRKEQKKEIKRIKQEYEKKLLQAKSDVEVLMGQKNLLADVLKHWQDRPPTVTNINQLESVGMKIDNSRHFNGSHNENVSLGDVTGSTVTQQINQNQPPAAENVELKNLLNEFQALIAKLPAHEQKEAQDEAKKLEEAANKPKEEQESTVRKTLRYFKGLAADLGDLPEIGTQFGEVIAKIGLQFE